MSTSSDWSEEEVDAALCVWEWLMDRNNTNEESQTEMAKVITPLFENHGYGEMRRQAARMGKIVEACWLAAPMDMRDGGSFDWEFVPKVCRHVDWKGILAGDEVDAERLVAVIMAAEAFGVPA